MINNPVKRHATYQDLVDAPEGLVAELIHGDLYLFPRPNPKHTRVNTNLPALLIPRLQFGQGGPGGWVFMAEPEIHRGGDVLVPDIAAWRVERYQEPAEAYFSIAPDWICEIASPSTAKVDREEKLPTYRQWGVQYAWIVEPTLRTLDIYNGGAATWSLVRSFVGTETVRAAPFDDIELELALLWG
jgi:Uma2 family endonuclease